jgi:thiol-disulfide isomerase/thioredoxin
MAYLTVAVVLVAALCLLDLVLTFGVIRRLRATGAAVTLDEDGNELTPRAGDPVAGFTGTTTEGEPVSRDSVIGAVVAFLSPNCKPCKASLPDLLRVAEAEPVVAVVVGDPADMADMVEKLSPVARVVTEEPFGPVSTAFAVRSFPTFGKVGPDGTLAAAGLHVTRVARVQLPVPSAVRAR